MLSKVYEIVSNQGWQIGNIDSVIVAERPKLMPYIEIMKKNIAKRLGTEDNLIGIKATTNERLGPEGRKELICCKSVL